MAFLSVFGFYGYVNLHNHEENCEARRGTEYQCCIDSFKKSLNFFLLGNQHFLFPLACTCYISEWESASESTFSEKCFQRANFRFKICTWTNVNWTVCASVYITITAPLVVWKNMAILKCLLKCPFQFSKLQKDSKQSSCNEEWFKDAEQWL